MMQPSGKYWKRPKTEDTLYYEYESIVGLINPTKAAGHSWTVYF